jgi:hypothetical protein
MSGATLARELNVPTDHIVGILSGQGAITGDMALRLAHVFRHERAIPAKPSESLRAAHRRGKGRNGNQETADPGSP